MKKKKKQKKNMIEKLEKKIFDLKGSTRDFFPGFSFFNKRSENDRR